MKDNKIRMLGFKLITLAVKTKSVLLQNLGDHRQCPHCGKSFIPHDSTTLQTQNLYNELFGEEK